MDSHRLVLYAVRKTSRSATYQGRLSIRTISDVRRGHKAENSGDTSRSDADQGRRGWWDYVPEASQSNLNLLSTTPKPSSDTRRSIRLPRFSHLSSTRPSQSVYRKSSIRGEHPIPQPLQRAPSVTFSRVRSPQARESAEDPQAHHRRLSSASSMMSRISKYIPRMQLFKEVLRNEVSIMIGCPGHHSPVHLSVAHVYGIPDRHIPPHGYLDVDL